MGVTLTVIHPQVLNQLPVLPEKARWLYADDNPVHEGQVVRQFGELSRLLSPAEFQARLASSRSAYIAWMDDVMGKAIPEAWIPCSYFKDMYCTPTFLHFVFLDEIHAAARAYPELVIITDSLALMRQLERLVTALEGKTKIMGTLQFSATATYFQLKAWRHYLLRPMRMWIAGVMARHHLGRDHVARLKGTQIMVETFLLDGDIQEGGGFNDRFLPGLLPYYAAAGYSTVAVSNTDNLSVSRLAATYRLMKLSKTVFAPWEFFIGTRDLFLAQWRTLRALSSPPAFHNHPFEQIDVTAIAKFWWRIALLRTVSARAISYAPRHMLAAGIRPGLFLDWYENQAVDKAAQVGFLSYLPKTRFIALRQYVPSGNVVNFFSSSGEVRSGAAPRENWVCGKRTAELFAVHDTIGVYKVVPALRYAPLFNAKPPCGNTESLVIFLTSSLEESLSIMNCAFGALHETLTHFSSIRIKSHQALRADIATVVEERWPGTRGANVSWATASSSTLLNDASLVLTAGSSVAIEALCCGTPVVVTGRSAGLDVNPLEDIDPQDWRIVYSPEEFSALLKTWLPSLTFREERRQRGLEIRGAYFSPSDPENMKAFLPD